MKIVLTYEQADIARLIRQDLAKKNISVTDADIKYSKGSAVVSVEETPEDEPVMLAPPPPPAPLEVPPPAPEPTPAPRLEALDGGAAPADMSDVLGASARLADTRPGKFPIPEHKMLDGESTEFPFKR
jgi:hypothetical protein